MRLRRAGLVLALLAAGLTAVATRSGPAAGAAPGRTNAYFSDTPDPHVIRVQNRYYSYSTNRAAPWGGLLHVPVLQSSDLTNWDGLVDAFPNLPAWATPGRTWAPTVVHDRDGYTLFYSATERRSGRQCIGRARAGSPTGPFRDRRRGPIVCQREMGGSIDPYVFPSFSAKLSLWFLRIKASSKRRFSASVSGTTAGMSFFLPLSSRATKVR